MSRSPTPFSRDPSPASSMPRSTPARAICARPRRERGVAADEFDAIARLFAPLAAHPGARGLNDDAAVLQARGALVLTTDAIVEGVHFLPDDPIDTVAKKALRVNLSDLAAKGAKPLGVLVALMWPDARPSAQIADFARGLG